MNVNIKNYAASLLVAFLLISIMFPLSITLPSSVRALAPATGISIVLGSTYSVPAGEIAADSAIASTIATYSSWAGYTTQNWYGSKTNASDIYLAAGGDGYSYALAFYIGDGNHWADDGIFNAQQWVIADNNGGAVYDKDIFGYSGCGNVKFVMMWSCEQGDTIGGIYWFGTPFGMPYAWLHTIDLSPCGYAFPDGRGLAFLGFNGSAPWLTDTLGGVTDAGLSFLSNFYYAAMWNGYYFTINMALDYAAQLTFGSANFGSCILYEGFMAGGWPGNMVVYGDGSMHISNGPGGGSGGCPYVSTWNGTRYVLDNNILPAAEMSNGADVKDYCTLQQPLVPTYQGRSHSVYSMQISEFEHEHDYFDQVRLLAVDHGSSVDVGVSPYGEILTYSNPAPATSAVDDRGVDVLPELSSVDQNYYQGYNGSHVTLTFAPADVSDGVKLVIREDTDHYLKCPVYVQVLNATGGWSTVATFQTRIHWATDIINMTGYLPDAQGNFKVRLCFISTDKIDYVGLDTTRQVNIRVHVAELLNALSSSQGDVTRLLKADDEKYAALLPGQQIRLTFKLPTNQNSQRTFIFYTEGHYNTIDN